MRSRFSNLAPSVLKIDELTTLTSRIISEISVRFPEEHFFKAQVLAIKVHLDELQGLLNRNSKSEFTPLLSESNKRRDTLYTIIIQQLESDIALSHLDPQAAKTAEQLLSVFDHNPVNIRAGYAQESAQLVRLFNALDTVENKQLVADSSVASRIAALKDEQENFEELSLKQAEDISDGPSGLVRTSRSDLTYRLNALLSYLDIMALDTGGQWDASAAVIEEMITVIMTPARARRSRSESGSEEILTN